MYQTGLIFPVYLYIYIYIYYSQKGSTHFSPNKIRQDFCTTSSLYVLKCPDAPLLYTTDGH